MAAPMELYNIAVAFGPASTCWGFLFRSKEQAQAAHDCLVEAKISKCEVKISDDFGQTFDVNGSAIVAILFEALLELSEAQLERGLLQARAQARASTIASNDPTLRASAMLHGNNGAGGGMMRG